MFCEVLGVFQVQVKTLGFPFLGIICFPVLKRRRIRVKVSILYVLNAVEAEYDHKKIFRFKRNWDFTFFRKKIAIFVAEKFKNQHYFRCDVVMKGKRA